MKNKDSYTLRERKRRAEKYNKWIKTNPDTTIVAYERDHEWNRGTLNHMVKELNSGKFNDLTDAQLDLTRLIPEKEVFKIEKEPGATPPMDTVLLSTVKDVAAIKNIMDKYLGNITKDVDLIKNMVTNICTDLGI